MNTKLFLVIFSLLVFTELLGQNKMENDSLKCGQLFDSLSGRLLCKSPEQRADFKGGNEWFGNYIDRHLTYDNKKINASSRVTIFITFIVEEDGSISNVSSKYKNPIVPEDIIAQAIEVIKKMPKMKPAKCNHQNVAVRVTQPIILMPDKT